MSNTEFRAELVKIMPGYSWTVHQQGRTSKWLREKHPDTFTAAQAAQKR